MRRGRTRPGRTRATALSLALCAALAGCGPDKTTEDGSTQESPSAVPGPSSAPEAAASPEPSARPAPSPPFVAADTASALPAMALPPRDDCAGQPGWPEFRARLAAAVATRDAQALADLSARDVTLDYGGGHGPASLRKQLSAPSGAAIWADLARIMPLGCAIDGQMATMPWFFAHLPETVDPGMTMLVTGSGVPLRARPSDTAPEVARLDWALVSLAPGFNPAARYAAVITGRPQRKGWVAMDSLRSLLARRILAERTGDGWRIAAVIAGD